MDSIADEVISNPDGESARLYSLASALSSSKIKKNYIEACLLASDDLERISKLLEVNLELLTFYRDVFYNVTGLDKLSRLELLDVKDKDEANLKTWGLSLGLDFIAWRLGHSVSISPVDGLTDLFNTCVYKSKEALFNKNDSAASRESTKWVKLSMDIARLLKIWVLDSEGAKRDLELALREVSADFQSIDDLDIDLQLEPR
jgi:hypothetical protein